MSTPRPTLILALDGATLDVIEPMVAAGELPNLARLMGEGSFGPLRSTVPPVTFPAWSSFMTGLGPGRHGIFDFTQKLPGQYRLRFVNASDRVGDSLFRQLSDQGGRVLVLGMPATWPPEPVDGLLVSGFDAPVSAGTDARSASDPGLYQAIAARVGPWMRPALDEQARAADFHERAVETLLDRIERKTAFALEALAQMKAAAAGARPALMMVVFSESDTVGHHYWRDHDPASPRHDPHASRSRRRAVRDVYARLDDACGELRHAYGEDAACVIVSDHGMGGASRHVVHLNRRLQEVGLLARAPVSRDGLARRARDAALGILPPRLAQGIFRRARGVAARVESTARFGGFDWERTAAFSEEANTQPGVWINLRGREAAGSVAQPDYEKLRDEVIEALGDWRIPSGDSSGARVVARALRREDVYEGPFVARAPDVVVELGQEDGYGLSLVATPWAGLDRASVRRLGPEELGGGRGRGMNGTHRPDGVLISSTTPHARGLPRRLMDVCPWVLAEMGATWRPSGDTPTGAPQPYSEAEDAMVAERLRSLGYLE